MDVFGLKASCIYLSGSAYPAVHESEMMRRLTLGLSRLGKLHSCHCVKARRHFQAYLLSIPWLILFMTSSVTQVAMMLRDTMPIV